MSEISLREYAHSLLFGNASQLMADVVDAEPPKPHSCDYCAQLLLEVPDNAPDRFEEWDPKVEGRCIVRHLPLDLLRRGAKAGCELFALLLPKFCPPGMREDDVRRYECQRMTEPREDWVKHCLYGRFVRVQEDITAVDYLVDTPHKYIAIRDDSPFAPWLPSYSARNRLAASSEAFATASQWLQKCHGDHHLCRKIPRDYVPSRLIEVPKANATTFRIVQTDAYVLWCALSYCWGGYQDLSTKSSNFQNGQRIMPVALLPRTILDALLVAHKLDIPYLWVDSLCILQDDPDDLARELPYMPKIYANAFATISASSTCSAWQGMFRDDSPDKASSDVPIRLRWAKAGGNIGHVILRLHRGQDLFGDPIDQRAWTLQERLLSPRLITYSANVIKWDCLSEHDQYALNAMYEYEEPAWGATIRPRDLIDMSQYGKGSSSSPETTPVELWHEIISQYCLRSLSFSDDRLVAISAVASKVGGEMNWDYAAGLWVQQAPAMALWRLMKHKGNRRAAKYRAPTWSWASVDSAQGLLYHHSNSTTLSSIVSIVAEPADARVPYGNAKSGRMTVLSSATAMAIHADRNGREYLSVTDSECSIRFHNDNDSTLLQSARIYLDAPESDFEGWEHNLGWEVYVLSAPEESTNLILKRLPSGERLFQRVGVYYSNNTYELKKFLLENAMEPETFVIV